MSLATYTFHLQYKIVIWYNLNKLSQYVVNNKDGYPTALD